MLWGIYPFGRNIHIQAFCLSRKSRRFLLRAIFNQHLGYLSRPDRKRFKIWSSQLSSVGHWSLTIDLTCDTDTWPVRRQIYGYLPSCRMPSTAGSWIIGHYITGGWLTARPIYAISFTYCKSFYTRFCMQQSLCISWASSSLQCQDKAMVCCIFRPRHPSVCSFSIRRRPDQ